MNMDLLPDQMDVRFWIVQAIGLVGFILFIVSMQCLQPRRTILVQGFADVIFVFHYLGLAQVFVSILAGLAAVRDFGSAFLDNPRFHLMLLLAYLVALYIAAFFVADQVSDWLGILGSTAITMAQFFRERFYFYRGLSFIHQALWVAVYAMIVSIPGVLFMSAILVSNVIGIVRYIRTGRDGVLIDQDF